MKPTATERTPTDVGATPLSSMCTDKEAEAMGRAFRAASSGLTFFASAHRLNVCYSRHLGDDGPFSSMKSRARPQAAGSEYCEARS